MTFPKKLDSIIALTYTKRQQNILKTLLIMQKMSRLLRIPLVLAGLFMIGCTQPHVQDEQHGTDDDTTPDSHSRWQAAYEHALTKRKGKRYAKTFADHYDRQRGLNKRSRVWAETYAYRRAEGKSEEYAAHYAGIHEEQINTNRSPRWADAYAYWRAKGKNDAYARTYADAYEEQRSQGLSREAADRVAYQRAEQMVLASRQRAQASTPQVSLREVALPAREAVTEDEDINYKDEKATQRS